MMYPGNILVVAAHPDDEILGCGGTIARLVEEGNTVHVLIVAEGATSRRDDREDTSSREINKLRAAATKAAGILGAQAPHYAGLPDNRLDGQERLDIIKTIERVLEATRPSTVYTHHAGDLNVDHRRLHEAVLTACRPLPGSSVQSIFAFETVSSTEWSSTAFPPFVPNRFVDITGQLDKKIQALDQYDMEMRPYPHARSQENVVALARHRGASAGLHAAEAFMVVREIVAR